MLQAQPHLLSVPGQFHWTSHPSQKIDGHSNTSDLLPDPIHSWEMLGSYWFSRRIHPLLMCVSLSRKIQSLNFFLDEKNGKIMKSNLNQLQNEIWWTWVLIEFWPILKQTEYTLLFFLNRIQCASCCLQAFFRGFFFRRLLPLNRIKLAYIHHNMFLFVCLIYTWIQIHWRSSLGHANQSFNSLLH